MKRIFLFISICALAFLAGCTKDLTNGPDQNKGGISFAGNLINDDGTKVIIGDYKPGDTKIALSWAPNDAIGIYTNYNGKEAESNNNIEYLATTETESAMTAFAAASDWSKITIPTETTGTVNYYSYYPRDPGIGNDFTKLENPLKLEQAYDTYTGIANDKMFLTAKTTGISPTATDVDLQFSNAFAMIYVGVKGNAKIDKITVENPITSMTYYGGTMDLSKAPAPKTTDTGFSNSGFLTGGTESTSVSTVFSSPLQLNSDITWVPIMTLPFFFDERDGGLTIKITGTDKNGAPQEITKTIATNANGDEVSVNTNSIIYLSLKELNYDAFGQNAPKTNWAAGEVLFADDFAWIKDASAWQNTADFGYNTNGWVSSYYGEDYSKNNYIFGYEEEPFGMFLKKGYIVPTTGEDASYAQTFNYLYSYEGMLQVGMDSSNGFITIPLEQLSTATPNITVKFRAARFANSYGLFDGQSGAVPMVIKGAGTIKDHTETLPDHNKTDLRFTAYPEKQFTWYDYTVVIEGVNASTRLMFGDRMSKETNLFFIDNINITIANGETTSNNKGAEVPAVEKKAIYNSADPSGTARGSITIPALKNGTAKLEFAVSGPWEIFHNTGSLPSWLEMSNVHWSGWDDEMAGRQKDEYGNQMSNVFTLKSLSDNDTNAERTYTFQIVDGMGGRGGTMITVKQPVAPTKTVIYKANFGAQTAATTPVTSTMGATEWGLGTYSPSWLNIAYNAENTNPGLALSNAKLQSADGDGTYTGATPEGNLLFAKAYREDDPLSSKFIVNVPIDQLTGKTSLYVNFGLWGDPTISGWDRASFFVSVEFGNSSEYPEINYQELSGWAWFENRMAIPEGATSCKVTIYVNADSWVNKPDNNYRIDDLEIATR